MNIDQGEFFREVTLRISSSLDVNEAMESLFSYLKPIFPLDGIFLNYFEANGTMYSVSLVGDLPEEFPQDLNVPIISIGTDLKDFLESEIIRLNLRIGDVSLLNNPWPEIFKAHIGQAYPKILKKMPSNMRLQLEIMGEIVGEFGLVKYGNNVYTREHARLLQMVKEPISIAMSNARRYRELVRLKDLLAEDNRDVRRELYAYSGNQVIGAEFGLRRVMEMVRHVAPMTSPVLLLGETGTGKEVIANAIHHYSPRRDKPIIRVQCGAIPDSLLDSELFGHEKGAFTGALTKKYGRFERAHGGTIFLDEIGELTFEAQVKLLRVLQEKEIERLGGTDTIKVDVRVIAATHRNLSRMVAEGQFREDLFFRLNVFPISLPPLRDRKEDIRALMIHFIDRKSRELGFPDYPIVTNDEVWQLMDYDWPGNVRELQNVIERALIVSSGKSLVFPDLGEPRVARKKAVRATVNDNSTEAGTLDSAITQQIKRALTQTNGKVHGPGGAAEILDMNPSTLRYQMRKRGITPK
jgi:transcriptional regulator with GAF, ATPase, and Fis domain